MTLAATTRGQKRAAEPVDAADLLAWYDRHRRRLPWRAPPGEAADPYRVWLSEVMLQQTTVRAVAPYYARFLERFPSLVSLAEAELADVLKLWAGLGYYARARNLHACARDVVARHGGRFPATEAALAQLPGFGPYTAAAVAAIAFDQPATPVDGNVERVLARVFACEQELPGAKPEIRRLAKNLTPQLRAGDFAQAMMDLGATICTPKKPACALCPWNGGCAAFRRGDPESFPRKAAKPEGTLRRGAAFVALRADGFVLVRTRPAKGLLGGMTEVPTTAWHANFDERRAREDVPLPGQWRRMPGVVRHVFTHFPLELAVFRARVAARTPAPAGMCFIPLHEVAGEAFPNLMRKVLASAGISPAPPSSAIADAAASGPASDDHFDSGVP
jgi:A/G-specific adenine glycosylase